LLAVLVSILYGISFNIFMNYIKLNIVLNNSNIYLLIKYLDDDIINERKNKGTNDKVNTLNLI